MLQRNVYGTAAAWFLWLAWTMLVEYYPNHVDTAMFVRFSAAFLSAVVFASWVVYFYKPADDEE